jgi:hypothetical protein
MEMEIEAENATSFAGVGVSATWFLGQGGPAMLEQAGLPAGLGLFGALGEKRDRAHGTQ